MQEIEHWFGTMWLEVTFSALHCGDAHSPRIQGGDTLHRGAPFSGAFVNNIKSPQCVELVKFSYLCLFILYLL